MANPRVDGSRLVEPSSRWLVAHSVGVAEMAVHTQGDCPAISRGRRKRVGESPRPLARAWAKSIDYEFTNEQYAMDFAMLNTDAEFIRVNDTDVTL